MSSSPSTPNATYDLLEARLKTWAEAQPSLRAVLVIGSRARPADHHPADAYSDLDTIVIVDDTAAWASDQGWIAGLVDALGLPLWFSAFHKVEAGDPEWEMVFEGGYKLDMVFTSARTAGGEAIPPAAGLGELIAATPYAFVYERGCRAMVNKQAGLPLSIHASLPAQNLPGPAEFENQVANSLLELVSALRMFQRGEYWRAAHAINNYFQKSVLTLLEWQARSRPPEGSAPAGGGQPAAGEPRNPARPPESAPAAAPTRTAWHYGRFLEEWAHPRALALLPAAHAVSTAEGVRRGILGGLALLEWLVPLTAGQLGFTTPPALAQTGAWLKHLLS